MASKQGVFIFWVAAVSVIVYIGARFLTEDDTSRLRRAIHAARVSIEGEDRMKLASFFADDYADSTGNTKESILKIVEEVFREFEGLRVEIKQLSIEPQGAVLVSDIAFRCILRKSGDPQLYADSGKLKVSWKKIGREWEIVSLEYRGSGDILFAQGVA